MMHIVAILHDLSDEPDLEDRLCAQPYHRLRTMRMILDTASNVNITAIRSPACRCSTSGPAGKPVPDRTWHTCWGVHRHTIGRWLASYASGGLDALLATYVPTGKPVSLAPAVLASLEQALRRPAGFASYEALRRWVRQTHGVEVKYKTLYRIVRTRFRAKLKVPRPSHTKKAGGHRCVPGDLS
jgi:transposase